MYLLLALLFIKHFVCDYPFQTPYMLRKSQPSGWLIPLTYHAFVHAFLTFLILLLFTDIIFATFVFIAEFIAHWLIDHWKAQLAKAEFGSRKFWNYLGLDQLLHNLTYLAIIFCYSLYMVGI